MNLLSVSILVPTLNSEKVLEACLKSITNQDYPKNKLEIIIADGGSVDRTLLIAKKYHTKIYRNKLKTGEAGKAVALKHAKGELVALIDSDNILPEKDWLKKMTVPFANKKIIGSEPWEFSYQKEAGFIDRYCAMLGGNDPLCYFIGNYDRKSVLSQNWTGMDIPQVDHTAWLEIVLFGKNIPTIGANGTVLRRDIITREFSAGKYLFDIDLLAHLAENNPVYFAKVKIGIIHQYCGSNIGKFVRKQKRRVKDYLFYKKVGARSYPWQKQRKTGLIVFVLSCVSVIPLLLQVIKGNSRKKEKAWLFHPLACWITLYVYSTEVLLSLINTQEASRRVWSQ